MTKQKLSKFSGKAGLLFLAVFLFSQTAVAQGLNFPRLMTDQKKSVDLEPHGIEFTGWNNVSGYNDDQFLPAVNKYQDYSGSYFQAQAKEIFLGLTNEEPNPFEALTRALGNKSWKIQADALAALGFLGRDARAAIPMIVGLVDNQHRDVRLNALWAMMKIAPHHEGVGHAAMAFFNQRLEDNPRMAFWALDLTGNRSDEVIDLVVLKTITNAKLIIQDALVFLRKSDYVPYQILEENLVHFDLQNRYNTILIVAGWPEIDRTRVLPQLILLVNDFNESIRVAASYTLGLIGRPAQSAAPVLRLALSNSEGQAHEISVWALKRITTRDSE